MAPEQARGKRVDRRADLWAFGCILFEMLAGRPAFAGETVTDILAAVVSREPDWPALPPSIHPGIRRLLTRCLERDPRRRLGDAGEARYLLEEAVAGNAAPAVGVPAAGGRAAGFRRVLPWAIAAAAVIAAGILWLGTSSRETTPAAAVLRAAIEVEPVEQFGGSSNFLRIALSPNGRLLAYVTIDTASTRD